MVGPLPHLRHRGAQAGWKVLDQASTQKPASRNGGGGEPRSSALPLSPRAAAGGGRRRGAAEEDRPPKRFTEATLLTAMETAGKTLDERELSEAMKETGLGTPATRAAIIETLLTREYIVRRARPGGHREGHPAHRGGASRREEPGDDGEVGGLSAPHSEGWRPVGALPQSH